MCRIDLLQTANCDLWPISVVFEVNVIFILKKKTKIILLKLLCTIFYQKLSLFFCGKVHCSFIASTTLYILWYSSNQKYCLNEEGVGLIPHCLQPSDPRPIWCRSFRSLVYACPLLVPQFSNPGYDTDVIHIVHFQCIMSFKPHFLSLLLEIEYYISAKPIRHHLKP